MMTYLLLGWRLYPCRHLILLIICGRETSIIRLILSIVVQKIHRKQWFEVCCLLNPSNLPCGQLYRKSVGHGLDVFDCVDAHYREYVG